MHRGVAAIRLAGEVGAGTGGHPLAHLVRVVVDDREFVLVVCHCWAFHFSHSALIDGSVYQTRVFRRWASRRSVVGDEVRKLT
jgi:hypothetical protein